MIQTGWNIVAVARQPIVDAQYSEIRTGISRVLQQAGLLVER